MTITNFEQDHVHEVYNSIALDFSRTRHTCWPFIESFLNNLPFGSLVLDAGCGNGKYLGCSNLLGNKLFNPIITSKKEEGEEEEEKEIELTKGEKNGLILGKKGKLRKEILKDKNLKLEENKNKILSIGLDMSLGLLSIANFNNYEVIRGDCFNMNCFRQGSFDHAISIAIIHHFATPERRLESVKQLILSVLPLCPSSSSSPHASTSTSTSSRQSTILIVVWALEQDPTLSGLGSARRRAKKGVLPISDPTTSKEGEEGKKEEDCGGEKETDPDEQDVFVKWELQPPSIKKVKPLPQFKKGRPPFPSSTSSSSTTSTPTPIIEEPEPTPIKEEETKPTFKRYYHLFKFSELSGLVQLAAESLNALFVPCPNYKGLGLNLEELTLKENTKREGEGEGKEWKVEIELMGEVWERENWCVRIGVRWILV